MSEIKMAVGRNIESIAIGLSPFRESKESRVAVHSRCASLVGLAILHDQW